MGGNILRNCVIAVFVFAVFVLNPEYGYAKTFVVNSSEDILAVCESVCTLRSALHEANGNSEADVIAFDYKLKEIFLEEQLIVEDDVDDEVDVILRGRVIINAQMKDRVFTISDNADVIMAGLKITGGYVKDGVNAEGAGILNFGDLKLYTVSVHGNRIKQSKKDEEVYIRGAGIMNAGGATLKLVRSTIGPRNYLHAVGYDAEAYGAGIFNAGELDIEKSNVHGNYAFARSHGDQGFAKSRGGGLYTSVPYQRIDIRESSIYNNTVKAEMVDQAHYAKAQGAGMYFKAWSEAYITNSTISSNKAISNGYTGPYSFAFAHGGGLYTNAYAKLYFANVTIAHNSVGSPLSAIPNGAAVGSGVFAVKTGNTDVVFKNSIISNSGQNCNYGLDSEGYNTVIDATCKLNKVGDQQNTDPLLQSLASNSSFTKTHALQNTSPAKDTAHPNGCYDFEQHLLTKDQRGKYRPQLLCDRGAYEF